VEASHLPEEPVDGMGQRQLQLRASVWEEPVSTWGKEPCLLNYCLKLTAIDAYQRKSPGMLPPLPKPYTKPKPTDSTTRR
jgi:hypothetical protein